ncbi:MAG: dehydrogenase, partial [Planctomycetia bacterium]|nr:dehydrogenase [Planctomycetia bacterium]
DEIGGGHAHCGTMIYLGGSWPDQYRNTVFMNNIHGKRVNNDILKRLGSGYTASHGPDLMKSQDTWFMGVTIMYGPDGSVFVSDWSDTGECHSVKNTRRHTGRIYKLSYGPPEAMHTDVSELTDDELVALQLHDNDWWVRHARRVLHERAASERDMANVNKHLRAMFDEQAEVPRKLRALWALQVTGGLDEAMLNEQLGHASEYVRAWAVRLLSDHKSLSPAVLDRFVALAAAGDSSFVRLHLASALQSLPCEQRWPIAEALAARAEDADDANLPLMLWYGIEPLVHDDLDRFIQLAATAKIPLVRQHIARRVAELTP